MLTIAYYFLKVIAVSGILMCYYRLFLFNKKFHAYNRFYLLFTVVFSWLIPLITIHIAKPKAVETISPVYQFVNIVADNNSEIETIVQQPKSISIDYNQLFAILYFSVSAVLFISIVAAFVKMYKLLKKHSCKNFEDVYLIITNAKGTPFSFFKYIFWNEAIQLNTDAGKQILQHELVHVKEKHSADKLLLQLVLLLGWANPFFWWAKKELNMIHEFIADNASIEDGSASKLAAMLLTASYPQQQYLFSNPFFFSPIKRRLSMLTNTKNPRLSYARRIVVLPILAITILLFAFRKKEQESIKQHLDKVYTVVIDAGHGGTDFGASNMKASEEGKFEKDFSLAIAKKVLQQNNNDKIKIILSRDKDEFIRVTDRTDFVKKVNADLFISIHTDWSPTGKQNGIGVFVPKTDRKGYEQCVILANAVGEQMRAKYNYNGIRSRKVGVWVLEATECPAALVECGFISNKKDLALLKDEAEQTNMANLILKGIENYLNNTPKNVSDIVVSSKVPKYGELLWTISSKQENEIIGKEKLDGDFVRKIWGDSLFQIHVKTDKKIFVSSLKEMELLLASKKITKKLFDYCSFLEEGWRMTYTKTTNTEISKPELEEYLAIAKESRTTHQSADGHAVLIILDDKKKQRALELYKKMNNELQRQVPPIIGLVLNVKKESNPKRTDEIVEKSVKDGASFKIEALNSLTVVGKENDKFTFEKALFILDGKQISRMEAYRLSKEKLISTIKIIKDPSFAIRILPSATNGLVILTLKNNAPLINSPLKNSTITQNFGKYILPNSKIVGVNNGVVISSKTDNNVKAIENGSIVYVAEIGDEKAVIVKKDNQFFTYSHLEKVNVSKGETLEKGKIIGDAKWENEHYEVMFMLADNNGQFINPSNLFTSFK